MRSRVSGSGFRVRGEGLRFPGSGFGVSGLSWDDTDGHLLDNEGDCRVLGFGVSSVMKDTSFTTKVGLQLLTEMAEGFAFSI